MNIYKKGQIVEVKVSGIEAYGIFVKLDNESNGLIHISEISSKFVKDINDFVKIDDLILAKIIDVDHNSKHISLSIKETMTKPKKTDKSKKIIETEIGFKSLAKRLPTWIEEKLKK